MLNHHEIPYTSFSDPVTTCPALKLKKHLSSYQTTANFDDICVYCTGDVPPWSNTEEFYPQCDDCADKARIANVKNCVVCSFISRYRYNNNNVVHSLSTVHVFLLLLCSVLLVSSAVCAHACGCLFTQECVHSSVVSCTPG